MLELLGSGYVMDHCIAAHNDRQEWQSWLMYMSDSAAAIINGFQDGIKFPRWWNMLHKGEKTERTGDEIALDVLLRSGLKSRGGVAKPHPGNDRE